MSLDNDFFDDSEYDEQYSFDDEYDDFEDDNSDDYLDDYDDDTDSYEEAFEEPPPKPPPEGIHFVNSTLTLGNSIPVTVQKASYAIVIVFSVGNLRESQETLHLALPSESVTFNSSAISTV